jgi:3-methyladenine DNA glycosylase AlkD
VLAAHPTAIAAAIDVELRRNRNPARAPAEKAYLKSDLDFLGVGLPQMRQIVRAVKRADDRLDRRQLVSLASILWRTPVFERRMMAILLLEAFEPLLRPVDIALLERLIRQSKTWAFVDELAIVIVGPLVERSPGLLRVLDRWAQDSDFWVRRSAMLALLRPLRRGNGDFRVCPLRRTDARGARVLHPQVDRLGAPRDRQATAGHDLCLATATRRASLRRHRPRGREISF